MKLIERYIFRKAGLAALVTLLALVGVVWIVQALKGVDIITSKGQTIIAYLMLTTLVVPNLVLAVVPLALFIGCIYAISTMNTNTELVVVSASGASSWSLTKPLLVLAILSSLLAGFIGHFLSPMSLVTLRHYVTEMRADLVSVILREGTFNEVEKGLTFHIAERNASGLLTGILISDEREADVSTLFTAKSGIVTRTKFGSFLKLKDGQIQQTNRKDGGVTLINYKSYVFDLSTMSGKAKEVSRKIKDHYTHELLFPDPNDKSFQSDPGRVRFLVHERFSEMLWPFAYVMAILAFGSQARSNRQGYMAAIGGATITAVIFRGAGFSALSSVRTDPGAVYMIYALPLTCFAIGCWFVITNRQVSLPQSVIIKIDSIEAAFTAKSEIMRNRYLTARRRLAGVDT